MGYQIVATKGTADYLKLNGIDAELIKKVKDGSPHCVEAIESGRINIVINTTFGEQAIEDSFSIRRSSLNKNLPYCTTIAGASALLGGLKSIKEEDLSITTIQEYNKK
jgi:carbamoyl-phosphate synthase large subunit